MCVCIAWAAGGHGVSGGGGGGRADASDVSLYTILRSTIWYGVCFTFYSVSVRPTTSFYVYICICV